jgi:hypothetical protein
MKEDFNVFNLIKDIKGITYKSEESTYYMEALHDSKIRLFMLRQGKEMTNDKLQVSGTIPNPRGCRRTVWRRNWTRPIVPRKELEAMGVEANIATSDRGKYSRLMDDLKNQFTMGHNKYPRNITAE